MAHASRMWCSVLRAAPQSRDPFYPAGSFYINAKLEELQRVCDPSSETSLLHRRLLAFGVAFGGAGQDLLGDQAGVLTDRRLDLGGHVGIGLQEGFRILAALA